MGKPFIPPPKRGDRRRTTEMREVLNALHYIAASSLAWKFLSKCFPPVATVQRYFDPWRNAGLLKRINMVQVMSLRKIAGRRCNLQPVSESTESGSSCGYDAGEKCTGRKRHILNETFGFLISSETLPVAAPCFCRPELYDDSSVRLSQDREFGRSEIIKRSRTATYGIGGTDTTAR